MCHKKLKGFTLLEILIVIVIIGIISLAISLNIGNVFLSSKQAQTFAHQITQKIKLARQYAIFKMEVIGLEFSTNQYTFLQYDYTASGLEKGKVISDPFWSVHSIPKNVIVSIQKNQQQNELPSDGQQQIFFLPNGEMTPFKITIRATNTSKSYIIEGDEIGAITLHDQ